MDDAAPSSPFARVERVERTGSTNTDLRAAAAADPGAWPHLSVLVARSQEAGKGRAGRAWVTPAGTALTASVLLRPRVPPARLPWVTLLAGLALHRACATLAPGVPTGLKWPNDLLALGVGEELDGWGRDRKLAGILTEALPPAPPPGRPGAAVVLGVGLNVAQDRAQLPVPWATSLRILGSAAAPSDALDALGRELAAVLRRWEEADGDAESSGLADDVRAASTTLGRQVSVELPGGEIIQGRADDLGPDGHLLVTTTEGATVTVAAGDVLHVRVPG
ncbi:biotin--[acetyl-CoA-carboxylase] ligase [Georgenia subflava]|uniref:biotin--[biotin carboxyl-carrier protein] ligase n=1 Tax=Georgenia subflava TaxID=1622177 RepID=A0A6N7EJ28_9MICO|nr:biotin--[acetyl-CoA-carboxylase] ligase [Georgenia subflava]MPV38392.1 biotin--[acetyl-CoA-carboxylase] ligase [Georgenia subflava]